MDESTIEITPEERKRIIANIKNNRENISNTFFGTHIAKAIQANYHNDNECWDKLIALIESAPAKRNMKAAEFANKLEKAVDHEGSIYSGIAECLGYDGAKTFGREDVKRLCDAIRNLDVPDDGIPCPLDKDGVPIKIGDTVYPDSGNKYEVISILIGKDKTVVACQNGCFPAHFHYPEKELIHDAPRTLEDIKREILIDNFTEAEQYKLLSLIDETYEMGKAAGNEEASEV